MRENAIRETRDLARENRTPARSWEAFEHSLADALATLDDEFMVVSAKKGNRFVQFNAQPSHGLRAEVVSNAYLEEGEQLREEQLAALSALGWSPPTGTPEEATPRKQPQGSPNFFRSFPSPVRCEEVARMAVRTLADVLRIDDPSHLQYRAFDAAGHPLYLPELHLDEAPPPSRAALASPTFEKFRHKVRDSVRSFFRNDSLDFDSDGDIPLRLPSTVAYLRVLEEPLRVRAFCVLAPEISEPESLPRRVYRINGTLPLGHLALSNGGLVGCVDILVPPFVAKHLLPALAALDAIAARFADELEAVLANPADDELPQQSLAN